MMHGELEEETEKLVESFCNYLFYKFLHERGNVEEEMEVNYEQQFEVNTKISRAFSNENLSSSPVLNDFQTFLKYISAHNGMKLTAANSFIVRKHVFALNKLMNNPEELKSTANQPDSRTIHLFYNISKTLNQFAVSEKNTIEWQWLLFALSLMCELFPHSNYSDFLTSDMKRIEKNI